MVLPPIIANNPLLKLFRSETPEKTGNETKNSSGAPPAGNAGDTIEISEAARAKFEEAQLADETKVRDVAREAGEQLRRNESATLGLNPDFAA